MKNLNTIQTGCASSEASLMWLKVNGYNQNNSTVNSYNEKERRAGFDHEASLSWLKRNGYDESTFSDWFMNNVTNAFTCGKMFLIGILVIIFSLFVIASVSAQSSIILSASTTPVSCNGGNNGTATVNATGGIPPYSYIWSTGATTQSVTGLMAGPPFTVTVIDSPGDSNAITVSVPQPTAISTVVDSIKNVTTAGAHDGNIYLNVSGGSPPYTYLTTALSANCGNGCPSGFICAPPCVTPTIPPYPNGLEAGDYSIIVTDANGCTTMINATVATQASPIVLSATATSVTCNGGSNGTIDITASGGTQPYTYTWSNGATTEDQTNLTAGTYTVTVTDWGGDYNAFTSIVSEPSAISVTTSSTNASCGVNDGSLSLNVSGGSPPFNYLWSTSETTQSISNLAPGTYNITVTDNNGCTTSANTNVGGNVSSPINVTAAGSALCSGDCVTMIASSSNDPNYIYNWAPASAGLNTNQGSVVIACPLVTTTYSVTGTDILTGCQITATITVTVVPKPEPIIIEGNVTVCDNSPGFYLHVNDLAAYSGGYPSGTIFDWGGGPSNDNTYFVNGPGDYTVTVTLPAYLGACSQISSLVHIIFLPSPIVLLTDSGCCISSQVFLGVPSYDYIWSNSETIDHICPGVSGTYTVTVTDANGCTATASASATQPCDLPQGCVGFWTFDNNLNDISSNSNTAIAHNGLSYVPGPCGYALSFDGVNDFLTIPNSSAYQFGLGEFTVAMQIKYTSPQPYLGGQPYSYANITDKLDPGCPGPYNGINMFLDIGANYPTPYQGGAHGRTQANNGIYSPQGMLNNATWHCLVYSRKPDANGTTCTMKIYVDAVLVNTITGVSLNNVSNQSPITIGTNSCLNGDQNYHGEMDNYGLFNRALTTAEITAMCNCSNSLTIHFQDDCDSALCVNVTGGVPPYSYQWNTTPVQTTPCATGITPCTDVTVTVWDANGASVTQTHKKGHLTATIIKESASGNDGSIDLHVDCLDTNCYPLSYAWSQGGNTEDITGLSEGTYCVTVTDSCGNTYTCCFYVGKDAPCTLFFDDYNSPANWTLEGTRVTVANSRVEFNSIQGCADDRIWRNIGQTLGNKWRTDFKFLADPNNNEGMIEGVSANLFMLSNNNNSPYGVWPHICATPWPLASIKCINVQLIATYPAAFNPNYQNETFIEVNCQINNSRSTLASIHMPSWNTVYYTSLERLSQTAGVFSVYTDAARTIHIPGSPKCFTIPSGLDGLQVVQHSNEDFASSDRRFTGWVDSTYIDTCFQSSPCISFHDDCDSALCVNVTGGVPPYTYQWNTTPIQTTQCATGIPPCTNVTVTVLDANGSAVTVTHKKALLTGVVTNSTCYPGNGGVVFNISCIDANCLPLTYVWKNGSGATIATTKNLTGVVSGTYCVTATDACGNQYQCCYEVKCSCLWDGCIKFNTALAKLTVTPSTIAGCTFTYHWTTYPGLQTHTGTSWAFVPAFTSVTLKVISCCGDTVIKTFSPLTNPVLTKINPCCNINDGIITASNISGGSLPCTGYIYIWEKSNTGNFPWLPIVGATGNQLFGCIANKWYRFTVKDCCGNSITSAKIKMGAYVPFTISAIKSIASDCGTLTNIYNGSVSFKVSSTCASITYSYTYYPFPNCPCLPPAMSFGSQSLPLNVNVANITGLAPGTYIFFIVRCGVLYQITVVVHFKKPTIKFHFTNCGDNVCIESNACCNVTYSWSNGSTQQCQTNLLPGTYTATVTDCEGQTVSRTFTKPTVIAAIQNANCGLGYGNITLTISNWGNAFSYNWDNAIYSFYTTTKIIYSGNVSPGVHCVKIYNSAGDLWECCYTITTSPAVSFVIAKGGCRSNCITVLTGTPPYSYEWKECGSGVIASTASCFDQCGCYIVKVTDINGCSNSIVYNIAGVKINDANSCGLCADMCGGCSPYSYLWSNSATTQCINCLTTGAYTVTVTDCNGVTYSCSKAFTLSTLSAQLMNVQQPAGNIEIKVSGGCLPYTCHYSINNQSPFVQPPPGTTNPFTFNIPNYVPNDWYTVTINDACGSTVSAFQFYARTAQNGFDKGNELPNPVLAPNPNNGIFNVQFTDAWENINVDYQVLDLAGKEMLHGKILVVGSLVHRLDMSDKPKGLYMIHFTSINKSWTNKIIIQ
ncbi:MAG: T9SS type A sorting domain-containing protein [Bacteroidia bacterium]